MSQLKQGAVAIGVGFLLSGAQAPPTPVLNQAQPTAFALTRTGNQADVPLLYFPDVRSGHPQIEVMLNGQGPFRMVVDTGFPKGQVALFPDTARTLELSSVGTTVANDGSGKQAAAGALYKLESVKIGGLSFLGAKAIEIAMAGAAPGGRPPFDGIIGMGLFHDLLLSIDYKNMRLAAYPGSLPKPDGKTTLKYDRGPGDLVKIPLMIGAKKLFAVLDTGNGGRPLAVPEKVVADLPTRGEEREDGTARTVSQQLRTKAVSLAAPVTFGSVILPVPEVSYPAPSHANLGSLALKGMAVTVDQKNSRVRIVPSSNGAQPAY